MAQQQVSLTGQLVNKEGPLPFANITLLDDETGRLITGVISDEEGKFILKTEGEGRFRLSISSIGYQTMELEPFMLTVGERRDFGTLQLEEEVSLLDEVVVKGKRPEIIFEADKTVVQLEGTVMAEGSTAFDVISQSPGIYVDANESLNLNGSSGVVVMIDGRRMYMTSGELASYLRAMPADNIRSLEIMDNPPAKYDAEGSAGVVNIRLKENRQNGIQGSISFGSKYNGEQAPFAGGGVEFKSNRWIVKGNLNYRENARIIDSEAIRRFETGNPPSVFREVENLKLLSKDISFIGGVDYRINKRHSVGADFNLVNSISDNTGKAYSTITNEGNPDILYLDTDNDGGSEYNRYFSNFHYIYEIDTTGTTLSMDMDVANVEGERNSLLTTDYWLNSPATGISTGQIYTKNFLDYDIFTSKIDLIMPFNGSRVFETGLKGSWVQSDNDLNITQEGEGGPVTSRNSNRFLYDEQVLAAYASFKSPLNPKFSLQLGLRTEYTEITGNSVTSGQIKEQKYIDIFPTAYLEHRLNDNYKMIYNYNRRILRPNYSLLNPFVLYSGPLTTEEGNPNLRPQYVNDFEVSGIIKNLYKVSLNYSHTKGAFQQILLQNNETLETRYRIENFDSEETVNLRMLAPFKIAEWWDINQTVQLYYKRFQIQLDDQLFNQGQLSTILNIRNTLSLPEDFNLVLLGTYLSPYQQGQMKIVKGYAWADVGISKKLLNDKLTIAIVGMDIFRTHRVEHVIDFGAINTVHGQYNNLQSVSINLRYSFSKGEKFNASDRKGNQDERNRLD